MLRKFSWAELQRKGQVPNGVVVSADTESPQEYLRLVYDDVSGANILLLTIESPVIASDRYCLRGRVRYDHVQGDGYLEMLNYFPGSGPYFSRTLGQSGLSRSLSGSSNWRDFVLPFSVQGQPGLRPSKLELYLSLPGSGSVDVGPLELVQFGSQWWTDRQAGWFGGIFGSIMGCVGALIGVLVSKGRGRTLVFALLNGMLLVGLAGLVIGCIALLNSQPYGVWYPLLLIGVMGTIMPVAIRPNIKRRFAEFDRRKMDALDAS